MIIRIVTAVLFIISNSALAGDAPIQQWVDDVGGRTVRFLGSNHLIQKNYGNGNQNGYFVDRSEKWRPHCMASTPPLPFLTKGAIQVSFKVDVIWTGWVKNEKERNEISNFMIKTKYKYQGETDFNESRSWFHLGLMDDSIHMSSEDGDNLYRFFTRGQKTVTLNEFEPELSESGQKNIELVQVSICEVSPGTSFTLSYIDVRTIPRNN